MTGIKLIASGYYRYEKTLIKNRWKKDDWCRNRSWTFLGIGIKFGSPDYFYYQISLFGIDINIWFREKKQ